MRAIDCATHQDVSLQITPVKAGWMPEFVLAAMAKASLWLARFRQRRALSSLDDRLLRDIGLTRLDAEYEIRKPVWRG